MAWSYDELEFPKCNLSGQGGVHNMLPLCSDDYDENDVEIVHPLRALIKEGKTIEAVSIEEEWRDDHADCINVIVTVEGKKYGFQAPWLSRDGYKMFIRASCMKEDAIADMCEYILS